jgi:hypothetical protein
MLSKMEKQWKTMKKRGKQRKPQWKNNENNEKIMKTTMNKQWKIMKNRGKQWNKQWNIINNSEKQWTNNER